MKYNTKMSSLHTTLIKLFLIGSIGAKLVQSELDVLCTEPGFLISRGSRGIFLQLLYEALNAINYIIFKLSSSHSVSQKLDPIMNQMNQRNQKVITNKNIY